MREELLRNSKYLYQWTDIDECMRMCFVFGVEEHTLKNPMNFSHLLLKAFPFKIQTVRRDNGQSLPINKDRST